MKATGIVRRIDDLGRVVIPKEIRRTMRIREGDPLEIYTSREGEVIFKKYSLMGELDDFAAQFCDTLSKSCGAITAVTDRDAIIAVAGGGKRELMGKRISTQLEQIMEDRRIYQY
ncbi:MAG: AbrB/MazE/SpoVT family DNA-binding domain-containing protein, partial [Oscillospiraceae bacterium]|nr:AbrB/MazE/SpoVT family DNA-binding domain-containing protein [Oscillospiraceae bacterium]